MLKSGLPDLPDFPENFRILRVFPDFFRLPDFSGFPRKLPDFESFSGFFRFLNIFYMMNFVSVVHLYFKKFK
jgi:hypothetical protein